MIARLLHDVLAAVKQTAESRLRNLLAEESRRLRTRRRSADTAAPSPIPDVDIAQTDPARTTEKRVRTFAEVSPRAAMPREMSTHDGGDYASADPSVEITDPQLLLQGGHELPGSAQPVPAIANGSSKGASSDVESAEGPQSTVRESAARSPSPVRLLPHETIARVSGAGVVIRRPGGPTFHSS
jgi:hypothetical protein